MRKGFTLIEMIMVIVIMGIFTASAIPVFVQVAHAWQYQSLRNEIAESGRIAIDRMIREMRQINSSTSVVTATGSAFKFTDTSSQSVYFYLSGSDLRMQINGTDYELASGVSSLAFTYYDSTGAVIAVPAVSPAVTNIKRVRVDFTITAGNQPVEINSEVYPRRL